MQPRGRSDEWRVVVVAARGAGGAFATGPEGVIRRRPSAACPAAHEVSASQISDSTVGRTSFGAPLSPATPGRAYGHTHSLMGCECGFTPRLGARIRTHLLLGRECRVMTEHATISSEARLRVDPRCVRRHSHTIRPDERVRDGSGGRLGLERRRRSRSTPEGVIPCAARR